MARTVQDAYDHDPVVIEHKKDQIVAMWQVPQVWGKVGSLGRNLRVPGKETEFFIQFVAKLSGRFRVVGCNVSDDSFQIL